MTGPLAILRPNPTRRAHVWRTSGAKRSDIVIADLVYQRRLLGYAGLDKAWNGLI